MSDATRHPVPLRTSVNRSTPQCDHVLPTYRSYGTHTMATRSCTRAVEPKPRSVNSAGPLCDKYGANDPIRTRSTPFRTPVLPTMAESIRSRLRVTRSLDESATSTESAVAMAAFVSESALWAPDERAVHRAVRDANVASSRRGRRRDGRGTVGLQGGSMK